MTRTDTVPITALLAPDKLKGCLRAVAAAEFMALGADAAGLVSVSCPLADGGDGTLEVLCDAGGGHVEWVETTDALGRIIDAPMGILPDGTSILEAASCLGLARLGTERDPLSASSHGLGSLLLHALRRDPPGILVALGGTATMDGGAGMLRALGARLTGAPDRPRGRDLGSITHADLREVIARLAPRRLSVACDVTTPLGSAALTYAPQKGATTEQAQRLQRDLNGFGQLLGDGIMTLPGGGAAGGLGAALHALGGHLHRGIDLVMDSVGFEAKLEQADLVITAEGCLDATSLEGKVLSGIAERAQRIGTPVVSLAGRVEVSQAVLKRRGVTAAIAIQPGPVTEAQSREHAADWLRSHTAAVCRLFAAGAAGR